MMSDRKLATMMLNAVWNEDVRGLRRVLRMVEEALGFALDRCVGEMIFPLAFLGIVPKEEEVKEEFGPYPSRYCPLDYPLPARA